MLLKLPLGGGGGYVCVQWERGREERVIEKSCLPGLVNTNACYVCYYVLFLYITVYGFFLSAR